MRPRKLAPGALCFCCLVVVAACVHQIAFADPAAIMGCGNFNGAAAGDNEARQYAALNAAGVMACRIPVYPYTYYWAKKTPTPERLDAAVLQAHSFGITPVMLFEYYTRFDTPLGDYGVWNSIGKAFADRFKPNSAWWLSQGIKDYGISVYAALNEPDIDKPMVDPQAYRSALKGLADGVHYADRGLRVVPGGLARPNSQGDYTCSGLGPAIADLLNDGALDGIDLHTYNGRWAPLADRNHSAQHDFDAVKKAWGVTRDVGFYCTEFNYQQKTGEPLATDIGDAAAGDYFLTMVWDNLGVVGDAGESVGKLALCWNLFNKTSPDPDYAMCTQLSPWTPNARGAVYKMVADLTRGTTIVRADPLHTGSYVLSGNNRKVWVWQDREHWSEFAGQTCQLTGAPKRATELRVYGWDGLRQTIKLTGSTNIRINGLPGNETYMFVVDTNDGHEIGAVAP